ncbi:MAG: NTP transferase domain-containing protein [Opitutaceae bacterium]
MANELTLVILAAGMGSRFGGLKQVQPVGPSGELIIDYSVFDAIRAGFSRLVIVIREENESEFRRAIGDRLARHLPVAYAYQSLDRLPDGHSVPANRTKPWGTGHAALAASGKVSGPFAVINADDFYGAGSFAALGGFLGKSDGFPGVYALVGFPLRRTLSEAGAVSRGVCAVDSGGFLQTVTERTSIRGGSKGIGYEDAAGGVHPLSGDEIVSMNMWGFGPDVFARLEERFRSFLDAGRGANNGEFYLPEAINDLVSTGEATVRVLPTDETWFGVTYREDLEATKTAISALIACGKYPGRLWG